MPSEQVEAKEAASLPVTVEPVRVLVPSQIGHLGVEFYGLAIGRILVAPNSATARNFHPLAAFEDSEFLDIVEQLVAQADVGEGAADHDLVVAAA